MKKLLILTLACAYGFSIHAMENTRLVAPDPDSLFVKYMKALDDYKYSGRSQEQVQKDKEILEKSFFEGYQRCINQRIVGKYTLREISVYHTTRLLALAEAINIQDKLALKAVTTEASILLGSNILPERKDIIATLKQNHINSLAVLSLLKEANEAHMYFIK